MTAKDSSSLKLIVKLCSDKAAFEARTSKRLTLNMGEVKRTLEQSKQHSIILDTPHVIILKSGRAEITLSRDGRMLIKRVSSDTEATQVATEMINVLFPQASKK